MCPTPNVSNEWHGCVEHKGDDVYVRALFASMLMLAFAFCMCRAMCIMARPPEHSIAPEAVDAGSARPDCASHTAPEQLVSLHSRIPLVHTADLYGVDEPPTYVELEPETDERTPGQNYRT